MKKVTGLKDLQGLDEKTIKELNKLLNSFEKDLSENTSKYEDHELRNKVFDIYNTVLHNYMDVDIKEKFEEDVLKKVQVFNSAIIECQSLQRNHEYEEALELMESMIEEIEKIEASEMYENDDYDEYYCFDELFEEVLYERYKDNNKTVNSTDHLPFANVYKQYGEILVHLKRLDDAMEAFGAAMRWNPVNNDIALKYAEVCKMTGDYEEFFEITKQRFRYAYTPKSLAQCYKNAAVYFVEKKMYQEAISILAWGLSYEDKDIEYGMQELAFIQTMSEEELKQPSMQDIENICRKYGFPFGYCEETVDLAVTKGTESLTKGNYTFARYYLNIAYQLTNAEKIKEMLETLPDSNE